MHGLWGLGRTSNQPQAYLNCERKLKDSHCSRSQSLSTSLPRHMQTAKFSPTARKYPRARLEQVVTMADQWPSDAQWVILARLLPRPDSEYIRAMPEITFQLPDDMNMGGMIESIREWLSGRFDCASIDILLQFPKICLYWSLRVLPALLEVQNPKCRWPLWDPKSQRWLKLDGGGGALNRTMSLNRARFETIRQGLLPGEQVHPYLHYMPYLVALGAGSARPLTDNIISSVLKAWTDMSNRERALLVEQLY